jgi:hypothetical protein
LKSEKGWRDPTKDPYTFVRYPYKNDRIPKSFQFCKVSFQFFKVPQVKKVIYLTALTLFLDSQAQPWSAP